MSARLVRCGRCGGNYKASKGHGVDECMAIRAGMLARSPTRREADASAVHRADRRRDREAIRQRGPLEVGQRVMLRDDVLARHARSVTAHAGFTREQLAWQRLVGELVGKVGVVERVFPGSKQVNVQFGSHLIGIDSDELARPADGGGGARVRRAPVAPGSARRSRSARSCGNCGRPLDSEGECRAGCSQKYGRPYGDCRGCGRTLDGEGECRAGCSQ